MEPTTLKSRKTKSILRFAHPFYTSTPIPERNNIPGVGKRMTDFIATKLEKIPEPSREPIMTLAEVIGDQGAADIEKAKVICFHATGDTGHENGYWLQAVADAMSLDYSPNHPGTSPAFFVHLGDVIYYNNTDEGYHSQFYEPYKKYPGKIIAIPGNHDGELFKWDNTSTGQKKTLEAFQKNFCLPTPSVPRAAASIYRQMVSQPGVYWLLDAPFVNIIGLYSNIAEGPGFISEKKIGNKQKDWLVKTLKGIQKKREKGNRKALIIAVHHPLFSKGDHEPSKDMLLDIDDACTKSNIMPDAVLTAHAHSYQRFTRYVDGKITGDHSYDKALRGYGYQTITVTKDLLSITFTHVDDNGKKMFDKVEVDLKTNKLV